MHVVNDHMGNLVGTVMHLGDCLRETYETELGVGNICRALEHLCVKQKLYSPVQAFLNCFHGGGARLCVGPQPLYTCPAPLSRKVLKVDL